MKKEIILLLIIALVSACSATQSNNNQSATTSDNPPKEAPDGWVRMSFDITSSGTTENIKVIDSSPSGIFESEAIKALSKWKYKPKFIDGVAVKQTDLKVQLDFILEDSEN
ncbi:hypothetical protein KUL42_16780 [Alteromonas sp. KUL42]|uniref:energy transducer TonB n=1 Tax=Alteromonas sp. KUL42 TaxID=2480797 RepID=UPI001036025B|nr:energy transducer TonB [Alteromonas sp. KUL42]TAP36698.1 energy transducer TonB [Alteromonas sp. KUL42]GEA06917.1 hypothetical protein KUL42_16780 [Alteromonas sp. KUL42]